jgi:hypothetical protein
MRRQWLGVCLDYAATPADFYSGARKILRNRSFSITSIRPDLTLADCGFTKSKLSMLRRLYLHEESRTAAAQLWGERLKRDKYGSVGFHCFNHTLKGGTIDGPRSKRASLMGPCIQSVSLTLMPDRTTSVDLFYRTTELFKKFPADLIFIRDELLSPFDFSRAPIKSLNFHFANVTCHPMYFVTILPLLEDPIAELEEIKSQDEYFYRWVIKWTSRYLCDEHHRGIAKFAQALRVQKDARERIKNKRLPDYLRDNHPGYKGDYNAPELSVDED